MTVRNMGDLPHVSCIVVDEDTVRYGSGEFRRVRTCRAEQDYEAMEDGIPDCRIWRCECGEKFPFWRGMKPTYCPDCGARVVK